MSVGDDKIVCRKCNLVTSKGIIRGIASGYTGVYENYLTCDHCGAKEIVYYSNDRFNKWADRLASGYANKKEFGKYKRALKLFNSRFN